MPPPSQYQLGIVIPVLTTLVTGVGAALNAQAPTYGVADPLGRVLVTMGAIAWDDCQCGQLALSATRIYPSKSLWIEDVSPSVCQFGYTVVDFSLSLVRCVPISEDGGDPPPAADLTAAAGYALNDAFVAWERIECFLVAMKSATPKVIADFIILDQTMVGPDGMCAGSELHGKIAFGRLCPCG
jgi:hypothetical protein